MEVVEYLTGHIQWDGYNVDTYYAEELEIVFLLHKLQ